MEDPQPRDKDRFFTLLCLIGFFGIFSTTISKSPVLPLMIKDGFGGSDSLLGLISFFSPLAGVFLSLPVGLLIDRHGYRRLLLVSALFFALVPLGYLFVRDPYWLIPLRFLHGVATAILGPSVATAIAVRYEKSRGAKLGLYASATLVGRTIAPTVGGLVIGLLLARQLPALSAYRGVYVVAFIAALPVLLLALFLCRGRGTETVRPGKRLTSADLKGAVARFVGDRLLFTTALVETAAYFSYGIMETFLPVYMSALGYTAGEIGLVFSFQILTIALTKPLFGRLADTIDKRWQILGGILLLGAGSVLMASVSGYLSLILMALVFSLGMTIATSATSIYVADLVKEGEMGSSMGALSALMDAGQSSGPLVAGIVIARTGSVADSFSSALIVCVLAFLLFACNNFPSKKAAPAA